MTSRQTSQDIDDAAAAWAARLDGGPLSPDEHAALEAWSSADPRRQGALARAMAILVHFDRAGALGPQFDRASGPRTGDQAVVRRRQFIAGGALAAGFGALALVAPGLIGRGHTFSTAKGEVRSIPLADGSVVWLNTESKVRVNYSASRRGLVLVAGEALFDVAKDRSRPFVVRSGGLDVRAVGTSFSVSRLAGLPAEVMVREGIVDLARPQDQAPVRLKAGARALADTAGPIQVSDPGVESILRSQSWRKGMLDFNGTTLAQAAAVFARYSDLKIIIDDPDLSERSVTGYFSAADPGGFAQAVALSMNLKTRSTPGAIHLSR